MKPESRIDADEVVLGQGVVIEPGVTFAGRSGPRPRRVVIGDNSFIGFGTRITVDELEIGDYTTIHNSSLIAGDLPCRIGHCCWIGEHTILNSTGGLTLGNGVGIGAYSQLWTHIHHGDLLQGCRWNSTKPMVIEDDVWFVGHCIVSPITARAGSMALVGSVVTRDMEPNHVYAGVPAKDVTDKVGPQFATTPAADKLATMQRRLETFYAEHPEFSRREIAVVASLEQAKVDPSTHSIFDVSTRRYNRRRTEQEVAFMKFLLHGIKFFPLEN